MSLHTSQPPARRKEISCRDCGHRYEIDPSQRSSRCEVCGNIEFHGAAIPERPREVNAAARPLAKGNADPVGQHFALPPGLFKPPVSEAPFRPEKIALIPAVPDSEEQVRRALSAADGARAQEIAMRYQVEWQLWAKLVDNFVDPNFHAAYLTQATGQNFLKEAAARYRDHRSVMLMGGDARWQAEVAEAMLSRIEALALVRLEQGVSSRLPRAEWWALLPLTGPVFRVGWITLGLLGAARLFRVI